MDWSQTGNHRIAATKAFEGRKGRISSLSLSLFHFSLLLLSYLSLSLYPSFSPSILSLILTFHVYIFSDSFALTSTFPFLLSPPLHISPFYCLSLSLFSLPTSLLPPPLSRAFSPTHNTPNANFTLSRHSPFPHTQSLCSLALKLSLPPSLSPSLYSATSLQGCCRLPIEAPLKALASVGAFSLEHVLQLSPSVRLYFLSLSISLFLSLSLSLSLSLTIVAGFSFTQQLS